MMTVEQERKRYEQIRESLTINNKPIFAGLLLKRAAERWPNKCAVICEDRELTYRAVFEYTLRIGNTLRERGIKSGDHVMILYDNSINFYAAYYGIWQIGAIPVPVNTMLHPQQIAHIIENAQPAAIVVSAPLYEKMRPVMQNIPVIISDADLDAAYNRPNQPKQESVIDSTDHDPDALAVLLYTSGTTGDPKGVMLSSRAVITNAAQGAARFDIHKNERVLVALPLFHSYTQNTCLWMCPFLGATAIIVPKIERRALMTGLQHKPTFIVGIPQLYGLFCLMKNAPFTRVRYFISGGDILTDKTRMYFELIYRRKLCNGYGLTETAPFVCVDLDDMVKPTDTVGRPFAGIEYQIRDPEGAVLKDGSVGLLWIKGDNLMLGYYKAPEATARAIVDGWFDTGDLALINKHGKIVLCGREKDLIKSKGIKVFPQDIENVLTKHPAVFAAAVIGAMIDDDEVPVAYVATKEYKKNDELEAQLKTLCQAHLANYEIPRIFIIKESLPLTATGKVDKKILRKEFEVQKIKS